jgi:sporulation protein YlmC with PRC-barrel domain
MGLLRLDDIVGLEVLSSDAKIVGNVEAVGVDTEEWNARALKIALRKGLEQVVGVKKPLYGQVRFALETKHVESARDVVKLGQPLSALRTLVIDPEQVPRWASELLYRRVVCCKGREIGITGTLFIDPDGGWHIPFIEVEMDKEVFSEMNLKKAMFKKREVKVPTSLIGTVGDLIMLNTSENELARILQNTPRP